MYLIQSCPTKCSSSMHVLLRLLKLWSPVVSVIFDCILFNTETANKLLTIDAPFKTSSINYNLQQSYVMYGK